jgi:hypothetical protein
VNFVQDVVSVLIIQREKPVPKTKTATYLMYIFSFTVIVAVTKINCQPGQKQKNNIYV